MPSEKNQQTVAATTTKMIERMSRVRNSSRCSRKDIWPPGSSSVVGFFAERPRKRVAILKGNRNSYNQSDLRAASGAADLVAAERPAASGVAICDSAVISIGGCVPNSDAFL